MRGRVGALGGKRCGAGNSLNPRHWPADEDSDVMHLTRPATLVAVALIAAVFSLAPQGRAADRVDAAVEAPAELPIEPPTGPAAGKQGPSEPDEALRQEIEAVAGIESPA
ncbi:MAG: hypothetical protein V3T33_04785, partial [Myxococcota bacterium]